MKIGLFLLLKAIVLNNNSYLKQNESNQQWEIVGDKTEGALVVAAAKAGFYKEEIEAEYPRIRELLFDSERKRMSTIHKMTEGNELLVVKGAPEQIVKRCHIYNVMEKNCHYPYCEMKIIL